jgi:hypothetical protein
LERRGGGGTPGAEGATRLREAEFQNRWGARHCRGHLQIDPTGIINLPEANVQREAMEAFIAAK